MFRIVYLFYYSFPFYYGPVKKELFYCKFKKKNLFVDAILFITIFINKKLLFMNYLNKLKKKNHFQVSEFLKFAKSEKTTCIVRYLKR